jgi:hypothetical protein
MGAGKLEETIILHVAAGNESLHFKVRRRRSMREPSVEPPPAAWGASFRQEGSGEQPSAGPATGVEASGVEAASGLVADTAALSIRAGQQLQDWAEPCLANQQVAGELDLKRRQMALVQRNFLPLSG